MNYNNDKSIRCGGNDIDCVIDEREKVFAINIGYELSKSKIVDIHKDVLLCSFLRAKAYNATLDFDEWKVQEYKPPFPEWSYYTSQFDTEEDCLPLCLLALENDVDDLHGCFVNHRDVKVLCGKWITTDDVDELLVESTNIPTLDEFLNDINAKIARVKFTKDDFVNTEKKVFYGYKADEW